jgi:hypothetical protein
VCERKKIILNNWNDGLSFEDMGKINKEEALGVKSVLIMISVEVFFIGQQSEGVELGVGVGNYIIHSQLFFHLLYPCHDFSWGVYASLPHW